MKQRGMVGTLKVAVATLGDALRGLLGMNAVRVSAALRITYTLALALTY